MNSIGSGFISSNMYQHGFFSSLIKLPGAYTAGLVVAFYVSHYFSVSLLISALNFFLKSDWMQMKFDMI